MRVIATLSVGPLASLLPPAGPRYRLSSVLPVVLRGWLIEAQRVGCTGLCIEFEGNNVMRVEPQDVPASAEPSWSADLAHVLVSLNVDLACAAADLRGVGQAFQAHEKARAHWADTAGRFPAAGICPP